MNYCKQIKILTWNSNSIYQKRHELIDFISKNKYDIVGITETKIDEKIKLFVPGYKIFR